MSRQESATIEADRRILLTVTSWITYARGRALVALRAVQWSDAPYWSEQVVVFEPASRGAVVTQTIGEHLEEGTLEGVTRRRYT